MAGIAFEHAGHGSKCRYPQHKEGVEGGIELLGRIDSGLLTLAAVMYSTRRRSHTICEALSSH